MKFDVLQIIKRGKIQNEYELEKALTIDRKLRLLSKGDPEMKRMRNQLRDLIKKYEAKNWSSIEAVSDRRVQESDRAEYIVELERQFLLKRKELIKKRLKALKLKQQELGEILGHNKTYMSQLINGICPLSMNDLIKIHHLLRIDITDLVPTILPLKERTQIRKSVSRLKNPTLKLSEDFTLNFD